jgi:flagellar assembly protein FliH
VAREAVGALLKGARHVSIALHPDDQALVRDGCGEALQATGAQLVASAQVARGGCKVESDMGSIDARIATRWQVAARALGSELPWVDDEAEPGADA